VPRPVRQPLPVVLGCLAVIAVLGAIVRGENAVTRFDADVVDGVANDRSAAVVDVARALTNLGDGLYLGLLLLAIGAALTALRVVRPALAFAPALSLAAGAALAPLMKAIVERPRPPVALHEVVERSSGFPSGHSTQAAAGWLALGLVLAYASRPGASAAAPAGGASPGRRWFLVAAAAIVVVVGTSRVVLGVHSPTDVLAGWLLGLCCALAAVRVLSRPRGD
jgi:undecaprenyl-diphosphatase